MNKKRVIIAFGLFLLTIAGCENGHVEVKDNVSIATVSNETIKEEPKEILYETVDVVVTNIRCTWKNNREAYYTIKYKSDEYGIIGSMTNVSNWQRLGYDLDTKKIRIGDTLKAIMYSTAKGERILNRELGNLQY